MALTACSEDGPASKSAGQAPKALEGNWLRVKLSPPLAIVKICPL